MGINRNIVECKEKFLKPIILQIRVLIETLWNVKVVNLTVYNLFSSRINRNIVECKVVVREWLRISSTVLIETLWNVKHINAL